MSEPNMTTDKARAEVARLKALQQGQQAEAERLRQDLASLEQRRGEAALAAVGGGDYKAVGAAVREVADARVKLETCEAMLGAIDCRLQEAHQDQRAAVVAAMRQRAVDLAAEVEQRKAERAELCQALMDFEGKGSFMLNPERCKTERMAAKIEQIRNAADLFVARGSTDCQRDPETGERYDSGLW